MMMLAVGGCGWQTDRPAASANDRLTKDNAIQQAPVGKPRSPLPTHSQERQAQELSLSQLQKKYPTVFYNQGSRQSKKVALTFDDVPDIRFTPQILDMLKKHKVKATFFVVGYRAQNHPDLVRRMVREGHVIGNHSYNHALLTRATLPQFERQMMRTQSIIRNLTGRAPKYYRPPYGEINEEQVRWAKKHDMIVVNWDVDSLDWKGLSSAKVSSNILNTVRPGSIVLQHGGGGKGQELSGTVEALPHIISKLRARGYSFVTVPDMLNGSMKH